MSKDAITMIKIAAPLNLRSLPCLRSFHLGQKRAGPKAMTQLPSELSFSISNTSSTSDARVGLLSLPGRLPKAYMPVLKIVCKLPHLPYPQNAELIPGSTELGRCRVPSQAPLGIRPLVRTDRISSASLHGAAGQCPAVPGTA